MKLGKRFLIFLILTGRKQGFLKVLCIGTLHYMKQNARSDKPFTLNAHVLDRVNKWEG